jgi:hypothetical protein
VGATQSATKGNWHEVIPVSGAKARAPDIRLKLPRTAWRFHRHDAFSVRIKYPLPVRLFGAASMTHLHALSFGNLVQKLQGNFFR